MDPLLAASHACDWAINLGDLPTWCAFAAAAAAGFAAFRLYGLEEARDDRAEERDRRAQAALVAAWHETVLGTPGEDTSYDPEADQDSLKIWYVNQSHLPVYDVRFAAADRTSGAILASQVEDWIEPQSAVRTVQLSLDLSQVGEQRLDPGLIRAHITFQDARGVYWTRDTKGGLTECPASSASERSRAESRHSRRFDQ